MNRSVCASVLGAAALISGCGGGGGSDDTTYNAAAAWQALVAPPGVRVIQARGRGSDGIIYTVTQRYTPVASTPTPTVYLRGPTPASRTDLGVTVVGNTTSVDVIETYYNGAGQIIGFTYNDSPTPTCADVDTTLPPTAARVGSSGGLYTSTRFSNCTPGNTNRIERATGTWSITSINGTPFFCSGATSRNASTNAVLGSDETCVEVATDGSLGARVRITINEPSFSLVATGPF